MLAKNVRAEHDLQTALSGRGCGLENGRTSTCTFCIWQHAFWDRTARLRSPANVVGEIEQLVALGAKEVFDDNETGPVSEFARAWKFDYFIGTQHAINDGYFSEGEIWVASKNKQEALKRLQELHKFTIGPGSIGVGDTESDIKTFELVDRPICFNPTSGLYKIAEKKGWEVVLERKDAIYTIKSGKITT
jgi:hypothetical protein